MVRRIHHSEPESPMPDYQVYPVGMWHMLGAVLLMVGSLVIAVMLVSDIVAPWFKERVLMFLELAVLVVLALILTNCTFLLSRGRFFFHRFLIWHNRVYILVLAVGSIFAFLSGSTGMAILGTSGLALALLAHWLYCSKKYSEGVEHYRLIWSHYRAKLGKAESSFTSAAGSWPQTAAKNHPGRKP